MNPLANETLEEHKRRRRHTEPTAKWTEEVKYWDVQTWRGYDRISHWERTLGGKWRPRMYPGYF